MDNRTVVHPPRLKNEVDDFILERKIRRVAAKTLAWHVACLAKFADFCTAVGVLDSQSIDAPTLRRFIGHLEAAGHNPGGIANIYRSVKTFLNWYELEYEGRGWRNPTRKVKVADHKSEPLDPISLADFAALVATCERKTFRGDRDRTVLLMLLDTGLRKAEIASLALSDINRQTGAIAVRAGKGDKPRVVYIGATTRRALLAYLRHRNALADYMQRTRAAASTDALWLSERTGAPITQHGIRAMLARRATVVGIPEPPLHSFRRAFALNSLRNGMDVLTLQRLLGHADLSVINRYVKLLSDDLAIAHGAYGVVDSL